jgi:glyoxylate reductase
MLADSSSNKVDAVATLFKIYATCDIGAAALARLRERGWELEVYEHAEAPPRELVLAKIRAGAHVLITTLRDRVDTQILEAGAASGLKLVAQNAVGVDNIDRAAATRLRIPFTNTPDVLTEATAEFAFFLMGCVARKTYPSEQMVRENRWTGWHPYLPWLGDEVTGRTVAVVGLGRIGRSFVHKAVGFDMDVLGVASRSDPAFAQGVQAVMDARHAAGFSARRRRFEYVSLDEALPRADFVSLHVPLTQPGSAVSPTLHLIDERRLRAMKPTAYLVNTSRGPVVDETALVAALRARTIAGAALDVFAVEPLPADSPLRAPDLALTLRLFHHFGSGARATRLSPDPDVGMAGRTVQSVIDVLEGRYPDLRDLPHLVNREAFGPPAAPRTP